MHYDSLYPGRFLKAATLDKPRTIRIVSLSGGAPSLTAPIEVEIKLPKRKSFTMTMVPTGKRADAEGTP